MSFSDYTNASDHNPPTPRKCDECAQCLLADFGYSNWTVEGTTVHCMVGAHPYKEFDRWYGNDWRLVFASFCDRFVEGEPQRIDVDREDADQLSAQAREFLGLDQ